MTFSIFGIVPLAAATAMAFSIFGILLLLAGVVVLVALISGLVLLIVGIAQKRRGVWIGGLITLIVALALLCLAAVGLLLARVTL